MDKKKAKLFSHIKLKGQTDLVKVKEDALRCLALASPGCRLRIDFNESLDHSVAMNLVQALGEDVCECIEFIEDPMRFDFENWSQLRRQIGLPLAVDRECEAAIAVDAEVDYLIIKPAVVNTSGLITKLAESEKPPQLVVTSYMDHAVGQMFAAYEAALLKAKYPDRVQQCGLLTHKLFESDEFFGAIKSLGPNKQRCQAKKSGSNTISILAKAIPLRTANVLFPDIRSSSMSRKLLIAINAAENNPICRPASKASGPGAIPVCTNHDPPTAIKPKKTITNSSPKPMYARGNGPPV